MPLPPFVIPRFNPREIPGLQAWYDAADSASITLDAGRVSQWSDKSGNARHATNATSGSTQPSYSTAARNGLNVLTFAAASVQRLTVAGTSTFNFLHNGTDSFVAAVSVYGTVANPQAVYGLFGNNALTTANVGIGAQYQDTGGGSPNDAIRVDVTNGVSGSPAINGLNAANTEVLSAYFNLLTAQTVLVQEFAIDADNATASQRFKVRVNGGTEANANNKTTAPSAANATFGLQIGTVGNNAVPLQGDICELMFFNQLPTAAARDLIRRYLGAKWGVTVG